MNRGGETMRNKKIMVRIDEKTYDAFIKQAEKERRSNSDLMRVLIEDYLKKESKKK